jgi:signal transduction histidine kinase
VQVLLNLLSNAIKYNRPGGHVRLSCEPRATAGGACGTEDSGRGIAHDRVAQLFTPFARLGAEQTEVEGTGLGLALSQAALRGDGRRAHARAQRRAGERVPRRPAGRRGPAPRARGHRHLRRRGAPHREATLVYVEDNLAT